MGFLGTGVFGQETESLGYPQNMCIHREDIVPTAPKHEGHADRFNADPFETRQHPDGLAAFHAAQKLPVQRFATVNKIAQKIPDGSTLLAEKPGRLDGPGDVNQPGRSHRIPGGKLRLETRVCPVSVRIVCVLR
jgi:hypothetical protein